MGPADDAPPLNSPISPSAPPLSMPTAADVTALRARADALGRALTELSIEEGEALEQLRSLKYALQLTTSEVDRRRHANDELHTHYSSSSLDDDPHSQLQVQHLEMQLLSAKRDDANLLYETETLRTRLRKLRQLVPQLVPTDDGKADHEYNHDRNNELHKMKQGDRDNSHSHTRPQSDAAKSVTPTSTPSTPVGQRDRLIADVDALLHNGPAELVPCRLGVSTAGHVAVYSYASAAPVVQLDARALTLAPVAEHQQRDRLTGELCTVAVSVDRREGHDIQLCGFRESVAAAVQLMQDGNRQTFI